MAQLTNREREVARLLAKGLTQRQIAHRLCLADSTVYSYTKRMRTKTDLTTVGIAVKVAQGT